MKADIKEIYVIGNPHSFEGEPNGTLEKPFSTIEEAIYSLSDDKNPEPHQLVYPKNIRFNLINAPMPLYTIAIQN